MFSSCTEIDCSTVHCAINCLDRRNADIEFVRDTGKLPINKVELALKVTEMIKIMETYEEDLLIQRECCDSVSNICMDASCATEMIIAYRIQNHVIKALKRFYDTDWRLCWTGCSSLWNMCRSEEGRWYMNPDLVSLLLTIMVIHEEHECVINTAIGALSNLALNNHFKEIIGKTANMKLLLKILKKHHKCHSVITTGIGLMANLAANNILARQLIQLGLIEVIGMIIEAKCDTITFKYNTMACLSNVNNVSGFIKAVIRHKLLEAIASLNTDDFITNLAIIGLVENTVRRLGIVNPNETTSYHMACKFGLVNIFNELLEKHHRTEELDFNIRDSACMTMMDYALENNKIDMVHFLVICGVSVTSTDIVRRAEEEDQEVVRKVMKFNRSIKKESKKELKDAIMDAPNAKLNPDVAITIEGFISPFTCSEGNGKVIDQLQSQRQIRDPT